MAPWAEPGLLQALSMAAGWGRFALVPPPAQTLPMNSPHSWAARAPEA
jgi:hypothetical protein